MVAPYVLILGRDSLGLEFLRCMVQHAVLDGHVHITTSPEEALEQIKGKRYHVVICDMDMPEANGAVFLEEALCLWPRPTILPILKDYAVLPPGYEHVAFSCLRKPLSYDAFTTVLDHAIEFNLLHRRVERYSQVLHHMNAGTGAYADQIRVQIMEAEASMRELWEREQPERDRAEAVDSAPTVEDCDAVLRDPSFGWAMETLFIHTADKSRRRKTRSSSKVA